MKPIPYLMDADLVLYQGDALAVLREFSDDSVHCVVTSPPYLDARPEYPSPTLEEFEAIFRELRRVVSRAMLVNVGRLWRDGVELRWYERLLRAAERVGWDHLDTRIWVKPNANPIHGLVFANSHEYVFVFGDAKKPILNVDAIRTEYDEESLARFRRRYRRGIGVKGEGVEGEQEGREPNEAGARPRSFFVSYVGRAKGNPHPAPMPLDLAEELVALGTWPGEIVLDPFAGSGTTLLAARHLGRRAVGIELNPEYAQLIATRTQQQSIYEEAA